jgi:hypothetical protein
VGFVLALRQATRARVAAEQARDHVLELNTVHTLGAVIEAFQDIRRLHRLEAWTALPDRYTSVRKELVAIRRRTPGLSEQQLTEIQTVVQEITTMERKIEQIAGGKIPDIASLNASTTRQISRLVDLLAERQREVEFGN